MKNIIGTLGFCLLLLSACKVKNSTQNTPQTQVTKPISCAPKGVDALADADRPPPIFEGLGHLDFPITTSSEEARKYFEQGFKLVRGFNHMEGARSFKWAIVKDPECAMCYWGLAYALGPNYNAVMGIDAMPVANEAVANAVKYMDKTTPREKALIKAIAIRYPKDGGTDQSAYEAAYADEMRKIYPQYPDDPDIGALFAEALMNLHPWNIWKKDGSPQPWTAEIMSLLEGILKKHPDHIASIHLFLHATEASYSPIVAKKHADKLPKLAPQAGHIVHMPSHTYIRTGHYHEGTIVNQDAVTIDSTYVSACHTAGLYPLAYYPHNYHFLTACAALEGASRISIEAAYRMAAALDTTLMREQPLATIQHYWSIPLYLHVKFAHWEEILAFPEPAADVKYGKAIWHYARAMAFTKKDKLKEAQQELNQLKALREDAFIQQMTIWEINSAKDLLEIAEYVIKGEMAAKQKDYTAAKASFEKAIVIEDALNYNEPPDWFFSVRHHLGPVLLKMDDYAAAETLYTTDLALFPETGWALNGLYESLIGQGKTEEAQKIKKRFEKAWQYADLELAASKAL
ncbi:MAG: hypothetical protein DHS20C18_26190 [Saprospiraceae bacterium]|nr:MAG: hypothetical protein DHS20C18_26190 [Saprospiraceae bacterium]